MPGGKFIMYAVVVGTPGISVNTTLPRDAKEGCSEFDLGVAAFELSKEEFQPDQRWGGLGARLHRATQGRQAAHTGYHVTQPFSLGSRCSDLPRSWHPGAS